MTNYTDEINSLTEYGLLPDRKYIAAERVTSHYRNVDEFWTGLGMVADLPILNGVGVCYYAIRAVWATLRAVGNLLILKPDYALDAVKDLGFHSAITVCLAVLAPIHALTSAIEVLARTVASRFTGTEPVDDLSALGFVEKFSELKAEQKDLLPSSHYFRGSRFFTPYVDALDCLEQLASPLTTPLFTAFNSLAQALSAVSSAGQCISNLLICKPKHAQENLRDVGVHFSLALSLALMTPINALVEGFTFLSRLGTHWVSVACVKPEESSTPAFSQP